MLLLLLFFFCAGASDAIARFYLHTRDMSTQRREITDDNLHLVNVSLSVKFIIHGWCESSDAQWYSDMTHAFLLKYDCNVIQVDWRDEAAQLYGISVYNTRIIGNNVGELIIKLNKRHGLSLKKVHICGHSLGGQVSGFAGKAVQDLIGEKVDRISGLDPAGPLFEGNSKEDRLDIGDANFVDITHTDGGDYGYKDPIGTVDFMPNGGIRPQPGCDLGDVVFGKMNFQQKFFCSHVHSYLFYIASINVDKMVATECDTYQHYLNGDCSHNKNTVYGEDTARNISGVFYFQTSKEPPYVIHQSTKHTS